MRSIMILSILLIIPAVCIAQNTLNVPGQFPTIQDAIDAAANGDTVLVDDGTYVENIDFIGKAITVTSVNGPEFTTIDGGNPIDPKYGSVVFFRSNEGLNSVLDGFTITNGYGSEVLPSYPDCFFGAGLYIRSASPTVKNNIITGNATKDASSGGGIGCIENASPLINDNVICFNRAGASGGGIALAWDCDATVEKNRIFGNWADINGGAIACFWDSNATIKENSICGNHAEAVWQTSVEWGGGGIYCAEAGPEITNNFIAHNTTPRKGGGIFCKIGAYPIIQNNFIGANSAEKGGGIDCVNACTMTIENCTLCMNSATGTGGALSCRKNSSMDIVDSILWNNTASDGSEIRIASTADPSTVSISYSDLMGGQASCSVATGCTLNWGSGMINVDPLFAAGPCDFFYLSQVAAGQTADSPCVDTGSVLASTNGMDAYWTRTDGVTDSGMVDMGFHYGPFLLPTLLGGNFRISEAVGGVCDLLLQAGSANANRNYLVLACISGFYPGTPLPGGGATLPLNWDFFTNVGIDLINTPVFLDFMGTLDAAGSATAKFDTLGPVPGAAGITMHLAYALNSPWNFVSNPVGIMIVP